MNREIQFNLQAAALEFPSEEAIDKAARGLLLDADLTAPTELPDHLQEQLENDPDILELADKNSELWEAIKALGFPTVLSARGKTPLYEEKERVLAELNRQKVQLRKELMEQARRDHFRNAPTERLNAYLNNSDKCGDASHQQPQPPPTLLIDERRQFVEVIRLRTSDLSEDEILERRFACMDLWVGLQDRKETQRRGRQKKQHLQSTTPSCVSRKTDEQLHYSQMSAPFAVVIPVKQSIPEKLDPFQCPFCAADPGLPYQSQFKIWEKRYRLWRHVEKTHRVELEEYSSGRKRKPCGLCKRRKVYFAPESIMEFKRHIKDHHGVKLRG